MRYLPKPSLNRWIAEALIDHHRIIEKIRADIPAGQLTLLRGEAARLGVPPKQDMESFNDQPIARGMGDTATDAIKTMCSCNGERREMTGDARQQFMSS